MQLPVNLFTTHSFKAESDQNSRDSPAEEHGRTPSLYSPFQVRSIENAHLIVTRRVSVCLSVCRWGYDDYEQMDDWNLRLQIWINFRNAMY